MTTLRSTRTWRQIKPRKKSKLAEQFRKIRIEQLEDRRLLAVLQNFDGVSAPVLPAGWVQATSNTNAWVTVASNSDSPPNHAFVQNIGSTSNSSLTSPQFLLEPASLLSFQNFYDTELDWDGGVLEISINDSAFTDILAAGGSFLSGGYVGQLFASGNPLAQRSAWHGSSGGYINTVVDLPASADGQNIALRWRFGSDSSVGGLGWRIDSISIDGPPTLDFGDAPTPYPVTLAENGARHTVGPLFLGSFVDAELNGAHSVAAAGDGSDEDGILFLTGLSPGQTESIQVTASLPGGLLNAWIDWNADGDWSDVGEYVFVEQTLAAGANSLALNVPASVSTGNKVARFRLSTATAVDVTGLAPDGEVEDYVVSVVTPGVWSALGPFSATNGQVENIPNRPVVGSIHTVIAHPSNTDVLYVGASNGGVWRTSNATSAQPNWTPLTDSMSSQSIGALAFDVGDASSSTIYAGIGRYSSFGRLGDDRIGLLRTINGGQDWQVVDGGGLLRGKNVSGVYANGNTIVVSVNTADNFNTANTGIFRSTDGGVSFTQVSSGTGASSGLPAGVSYDLIVDPVSTNTLYTSIVFGSANGVFKSVDAGASWSRVSTPAIEALITGSTSNLEMAAGRNNEVYAAIINSGAFAGLFRSPDGGATWTQMDSPQTNENGTNVGLNPSGGKGPSDGAPEFIAGGQGSIHFSIIADPSNPNLVYVGGDRQPRTNGDTGGFPNSIGAQDFSGRLFRGDASRPAGSQFVHLTHRNNLGAVGGGTASGSSPHADSREMAFMANGQLVEVDDGGVYRHSSPQTNTGDWFSLNGDIQVTEAHDVAWDALSDVAITGNQDTGTTYQPSSGAAQWISLSTADGGDVAVDNIQLAAANQSVRYTSFQNIGGFRRTIWNAAGGLVSTSFPTLAATTGSAAIAGAFRTPVETNAVAGGRLLILGSNSLYESLNAGSTITEIGVGLGINDISSNALAYGGTRGGVANPDVVWMARGSNVYLRTAGTGSVAQTTGDPTNSTIRDLAVNSRNWANAFVIDNNQVFQTTNEGATWSDVTGDLLSFASDLRSVAFVVGAISDTLVIGTNQGVFASALSSLGTWIQLGSNLPNVIVYDMDYDPTDDLLVLGTLGRGAWSLANASTLVAPAATVITRNLFYNNSTGNSGNAVASDKLPLRTTGQASTFANYSNYALGLNGILIDIDGLPATTTNAQMLASLEFAQWNGIAPAGFEPLSATAVPTVNIVSGSGAAGSTRVSITFPDNTVQNTWLRVTVKANINTAIPSDDIFYFGNVIGDVDEIGNSPTRLPVNALDTIAIRQNQSILPNSVGVSNIYDVNRDGSVNVLDTLAVRANQQILGIVAPLVVPPPPPVAAAGNSTTQLLTSILDIQPAPQMEEQIPGLIKSGYQPSKDMLLLDFILLESENEIIGIEDNEDDWYGLPMDQIGLAWNLSAEEPLRADDDELSFIDDYFGVEWELD